MTDRSPDDMPDVADPFDDPERVGVFPHAEVFAWTTTDDNGYLGIVTLEYTDAALPPTPLLAATEELAMQMLDTVRSVVAQLGRPASLRRYVADEHAIATVTL